MSIAHHSFIRFDSVAIVPGLHRYVLATEIRCHVVEFVLASRDKSLLDSLVQDLNKMKIPADASTGLETGGSDVPRCVKDYATTGNVIKESIRC